MQGHHHNLVEEFPEYREQIHNLKTQNAHFQTLTNRWEAIDKQIARAESRAELMSEQEEETLRKERLQLKDEIYKILSSAPA